MTYTLLWDAFVGQVSDQLIRRDEDGAFIPFDPFNMDYQEYLKWLAEGNRPTAPAQTPMPRQSPTRPRR